MRAALAGFIALLILGVPATTRAEGPGSVNTHGATAAHPQTPADSMLAFAEYLVSSDHASLAVPEYLRCLWQRRWDDSPTTRAAINGVAKAYVLAEQYQEAINWARRDEVQTQQKCPPEEYQLLAATAALRLERPREAMGFFVAPVGGPCSPDSALVDRRFYLEGVCNVYLSRWGAAKTAFEKVRATSPLGLTSRQYAEMALQGGTLPQRSPRVARWLGLFSGAGYFYSGFRQTGISAFIVNLVFAEAAREAFRHDQPTLGGFLTAFGASWYAGSIYGSGKSAERYNEFYRARFIERFVY